MKFSYNWLNEYFEDKLPEAEELATTIGLHSFELEGVEKLKNGDTLIDWDILPNRSSDCLCYGGMVKEISAVLDTPAKDILFRVEDKTSKNLKTSDFLSLKIEDNSLTPRATKRFAQNIKVGPSPEWLVEAIEAMGGKSINNVVDITNYVMWVTGQPVHAFDYDKLAGEENFKKIEIKTAKDGEKITDLTGTEHELDSSMLVISDGLKSLDIAGVKGGLDSGINENTSRMVLSAVNFDFQNIRNTAKKLKIQTDASKRFENQVPLQKIDMAISQFTYLLTELANAEVSSEIVDTNPEPAGSPEIKVELSRVNSLLGLTLEEDELAKIFGRLGFKQESDSGVFYITAPPERLDVNIWQDLAEEVGRIYGYENIPETNTSEIFNTPQKDALKESIRKIESTLTSLGFYEVFNRTIVKKGDIKLANSLNANATNLRNNLLEKLQEKAEKNLQHSDEPRFFEIGKVFTGVQDGLVSEHFSFAGVIAKRKIKEKQKAEVFYQTKGYLEKIFENLNIKNLKWEKSQGGFVAQISNQEGEKIGGVGVNFWEVNLELLVKNIDESINYKKPSKYPRNDRDIAFFVPLEYTIAEAIELLSQDSPEIAHEPKLFDIFQKDEKTKSFAFRISFQSYEKTLSDEEVNEAIDKVYKRVQEKGFEIR